MREIISALNQGRAGSPLPADGARGVTRSTRIPTIVFSLGTHGNWTDLVATGASVLGIDWRFSLAEARKLVSDTVALQGNFTPGLLRDATPVEVVRETQKTLEAMRGRPGYIFNLGHGLLPGAKLENISALVETVRNFK